jgi:hypothetical protein
MAHTSGVYMECYRFVKFAHIVYCFHFICDYRVLFKETKVSKSCGVDRLDLLVRLICHNPELEQFEVDDLIERFLPYFLAPFVATLGPSNAASAVFCFLRHRLMPVRRHVIKKSTIMVIWIF